jgi:phage terminase small subunit
MPDILRAFLVRIKCLMRCALRPKQQRFVDEYLIDLNATQAAIRAGYSPRTARAIAQENLTKPDIATAIQAARAQRTAVTADQVVRELAAVAFSDLRNYVGWGPEGVEVKASVSLSDQAVKAIQDISSVKRIRTGANSQGDSETVVEHQTRVKLYNKLHALDFLGRHLDMFRVPSPEELADMAFIEDFMTVVMKHVTDQAARDEIGAVIKSHADHPQFRRNGMPGGAGVNHR